jgi:hypothetical protein
MKRILKSLSIFALISACGLPLGGCQNDNEAGIATGTEGTGDPKYGKDDDATYRAFAKDHSQQKTEEKARKSASKKQ